MKFLKLFESKYYDEFEKLKQITGVNEIEEDIKDTIQDLRDDIDFYRFNNPQTILQLTYQRKVKRKVDINVEYYQEIVNRNQRILAQDGTYITGFLDKLTYGESLYFFKLFNFQLLSRESESELKDLSRIKELKNPLENLVKRLESLGFTIVISTNSPTINNIDIQTYINLIESNKIKTGLESIDLFFTELQDLISWNEVALSHSRYISILKKIDFDKPKIDTSEVPTHLSISFEDFIKKYRLPKEGQEELRQLLKNNMVKESVESKDDFEEVKQIVKDWFDSYTDELFKVYTGRVEINPCSTCPSCDEAHNLVSMGYDYDSGKTLYECPDCEWQGSSDQITTDIEMYLVNLTQFLEGKMNSINIQSEETNKWMLNYLNDKDINHLNSYLKPYNYSVFRFDNSKPYRAWITTILSLDDIKMCHNYLNDEFTLTDYEILIPEL